MAAQQALILKSDGNAPPYMVADKLSGSSKLIWNHLQAVPQVVANVFMSKLQNIIVFSIVQVRILAEYGYDSSDTMLYWNFSGIQECC